MKQNQEYAGLGGGTPRLHHKRTERSRGGILPGTGCYMNRGRIGAIHLPGGVSLRCAYDGAEIGSTGIRVEWRASGGIRDCSNLVTANNNFAPRGVALAA